MSALVSHDASTTITSEHFPTSAARTDSMQRPIDRADSTDAMITDHARRVARLFLKALAP
jgi:hypothetical protein